MSARAWKSKLRQVMRYGLVAAAILATVAFVGLWLAFQHKPGWYRPIRLDEQGYQQARREAVATADSISDQLVQGEEFEVVLTEMSVNQWLSALPRGWPEARRILPHGLRDPAVQFSSDHIRFAVHFQKGGWQSIVGVDLVVGVSEDGGSLTAALKGARSGSLPVPRSVVTRILGPLIEHARKGGDNADSGVASFWNAAVSRVRSVDQLFTGVTTRNRFVWPNGERPFRIESICVTEGEFHLRLRPL